MPLRPHLGIRRRAGARAGVDRPLASHLLRVIFGCYFGVAAVVTAGQMVTEYRSEHQRLEADIQAMQRTFGRGLADALWSFNAGVLHGILTGIAEMPVVVGVEVRDEHGHVVDRVGAQASGTRGLASFDEPFDRSFDLAYADENHVSHPVGRWTVHSNDGIALDQVRNTLVVILINSALKTLTLWGIFSVVIRRIVGRPLTEIGDFVMRLDADSLGARPLILPSREGHELHLLARAFNTLSAKLRHAFDANAALMQDLQHANATLQARVDERTRDLARLARTDQLTGLGNRRDLDEALDREAARAAPDRRFSVILGDIDHFKSVNDRHGHGVGDAVLTAFAGALRAGLRAGDTLGRWGGEEFMVLCPATDLPAAWRLAESLRRRMEQAELPAVGTRTCSFGVAELLPGESVDRLLVRADEALYAAKRNGRNRVEAAATGRDRLSVA